MTRGMVRRVERLEERHQAANPQRIAFICQGKGESAEEAIHRHGLVPGEQRFVILHRYGAAACGCRQREGGTE
jgi:hypothetical protein